MALSGLAGLWPLAVESHATTTSRGMGVAAHSIGAAVMCHKQGLGAVPLTRAMAAAAAAALVGGLGWHRRSTRRCRNAAQKETPATETEGDIDVMRDSLEVSWTASLAEPKGSVARTAAAEIEPVVGVPACPQAVGRQPPCTCCAAALPRTPRSSSDLDRVLRLAELCLSATILCEFIHILVSGEQANSSHSALVLTAWMLLRPLRRRKS
mmetsp:Transcript_84558/g.181166  ORF Transcript_84558/g.181166 Transcript_84558/m.181166 type:complete len:210 (+) Transcript_84558:120-749(+)